MSIDDPWAKYTRPDYRRHLCRLKNPTDAPPPDVLMSRAGFDFWIVNAEGRADEINLAGDLAMTWGEFDVIRKTPPASIPISVQHLRSILDARVALGAQVVRVLLTDPT